MVELYSHPYIADATNLYRKCGFETAFAGVFISHKCYNNNNIENKRKIEVWERKRYFMLFAEIEGAENEIGASAADGTHTKKYFR